MDDDVDVFRPKPVPKDIRACYACGKRKAVWKCPYCLLLLCEVHCWCPECGEDTNGVDTEEETV